MKSALTVYAVILSAILCLIFINGCKTDIAEPIWEKPFTVPPTPTITAIEPIGGAVGGDNYITVRGTGFGTDTSKVKIYFGGTSVEYSTLTNTEIVMRRPNLVTAGDYVKVVLTNALLVAKEGPYRIDQTFERIGTFIDNIPLGVVAVDSAENIYVIGGTTPFNVWKVKPNGDKTSVALALTGTPTTTRGSNPDAKWYKGKLYLSGIGNATALTARTIQIVTFTPDDSGQISRLFRLPSGSGINYFDYDDAGNLYGGGDKSDLCVVFSNPPRISTDLVLSTHFKKAGAYTNDQILSVKVYNGNVYVASRTTATKNPGKIWRHTIDASGNIGAQQPVADLGTINDSSTVKQIVFFSTGKMLITLDSNNPLVTCDPATGSLDYFYKNILPPLGKHSDWGTGNYLYMISNDSSNTDASKKWNTLKIDMGITAAP